LFLVNRQTGLTDWLSGEDLAGLLVNNGIRLAIFNSCRGAFTPQDDASAGWREQNLVQALVNRGVPGVIAMTERIPDDVAITFTQLIYRNLHRGHPIDLCLSRVRQGLISAYRSDQPFWMLPILYMRPEFDGYLYQPDTPQEEAAQLLQEDAPVSDGTLTPPDYSTDPEIFNLAQEVFAGHDAKTRYSPVGEPSADPEDWVAALESDQQVSLEADTATMQSLVQQLSPQDEPQKPDPSILKAPANEDLSPHWQDVHRPVLESLNEDINGHGGAERHTPIHDQSANPSPSPAIASHDATATPPSASQSRRVRGWHKPALMPSKLFMGAILGLVGLTASGSLAIIMLRRNLTPDTAPQSVVSEVPEVPGSNPEGTVSDAEVLPTDTAATSDSAILLQAVAALTVNNTGTSRFFIEQLLDQGDYEAAHGAIAAASNSQLLDPNIAFVRGRLIWQERARGSGTGSIYDAMRYWNQAIDADADNPEAWVALGFAHYDLGDYDQAVAAWENAIAIDRQNLRDSDPTTPQVADEFVLNAYAGLAMAYQALSEVEQSPQQRAGLQTKAQAQLAIAIGQAPEMLNPEWLGLQWLWTSSLISNWQEATSRLAVNSTLNSLPETPAN
jgi:tetratricopeptide (TPR) repeat protein